MAAIEMARLFQRLADVGAQGAERMMASRGRRDERHRGREAALQLLYQWEISGAGDMDAAIESVLVAPSST